jgi:hypothetical protein
MNLSEPVRFTDLAEAIAVSPALRQQVLDFLASQSDDPIVLETTPTDGERFADWRARRQGRQPKPVML